jgi:hypothetical protein
MGFMGAGGSSADSDSEEEDEDEVVEVVVVSSCGSSFMLTRGIAWASGCGSGTGWIDGSTCAWAWSRRLDSERAGCCCGFSGWGCCAGAKCGWGAAAVAAAAAVEKGVPGSMSTRILMGSWKGMAVEESSCVMMLDEQFVGVKVGGGRREMDNGRCC